MSNKISFALSLARKSGKVVYGFDHVKELVLKGDVHLLLIASDISDKTLKRVEYFTKDIIDITRIDLTQYEISQILNRLTAIVAITDENIAKLCKNALEK